MAKIRCQQCLCLLEEVHFQGKQPCEFCISEKRLVEEAKNGKDNQRHSTTDQ